MCLGNFITAFTANKPDLTLSDDQKLSFTKLLFELDFSGLEIGKLTCLFEDGENCEDGEFTSNFAAEFDDLGLGITLNGKF